jgi:hypothetical protein
MRDFWAAGPPHATSQLSSGLIAAKYEIVTTECNCESIVGIALDSEDVQENKMQVQDERTVERQLEIARNENGRSFLGIGSSFLGGETAAVR